MIYNTFSDRTCFTFIFSRRSFVGRNFWLDGNHFLQSKFLHYPTKKRTKDISLFWKFQFPMLSRISQKPPVECLHGIKSIIGYNTLIYKNWKHFFFPAVSNITLFLPQYTFTLSSATFHNAIFSSKSFKIQKVKNWRHTR